MKLIRLCMLGLCFPALLQAQKDKVEFAKDFTVTVSDPYQVIDANDKQYFYDGAGHSFAVKTDHETVYIQRFDVKTMKELSRKDYSDMPKNAQTLPIIGSGGKFYYLYDDIDTKGDDTNSMYAREIDLSNGTLKSPVLLFKSKGPTTKSESIERKSIFGGGGQNVVTYMSSDSSKILFNYRRQPLERKDSKNYDILGFYVFDSNLKKLWGDEVKMPYTEADMNNLAFCVTKNGDAHMLIHKNDNKTYELLNIKSATDIKANKIDIDPKLLFQSFNIREDLTGNLVCSGYYANGLEFKMDFFKGPLLVMNVNGIKHFNIDMTGKMLSSNNYDFPVEMINENQKGRQQAKNDKREAEGKLGIENLVLRDVILADDGSTYFVGEQFSRRTSSSGTMGTHIIYEYKSVVVTKIDKDKKLVWMKEMPKYQTSEKPESSLGYRFIHNKNFDYVIYLDNKKNFELDINHSPKEYIDGRDAYLTAFKIDDKTGDTHKNLLFDLDDIQGKSAYQFHVTRIFDIGEAGFILEVYMKSKKDMMVKLALK